MFATPQSSPARDLLSHHAVGHVAGRAASRRWVLACSLLVAVVAGGVGAGCNRPADASQDAATATAGGAAVPSSASASMTAPAVADDSTQRIEVTDDLGRKVSVPLAPARIVTVAPFAVEMLYDLGHPPLARPDVPGLAVRPEAAKDLPLLTLSHGAGPNLEQLAVLKPDVLVLSPSFASFAGDIEKSLKIPVLVYAIRDIADVPRVYRAMGLWLNEPDRSEAAATAIEKELAKRARPAPATGGPRVFAVFGAGDTFYAFLPESYLGSMVKHLGGSFVTDGMKPMRAGSSMAPFSMEAVLVRDPDVVLIVSHSEAGDPAALLGKDPAWKGLRAVKEGHVYQVSEWLYLSSPGPTALEALDTLDGLMYPAAPATAPRTATPAPVQP